MIEKQTNKQFFYYDRQNKFINNLEDNLVMEFILQ